MKCEYCRGKGCENCMAKGGEVGSHAENHAYNHDASMDLKGVHKVLPRYDKANKRMTHGESTANLNWSKSPKERHQENLEELRSMPKPKLKGLAHGGKVTGFDMNGPESKAFMEKGEFTSEAEGGEIDGDDMDNELMDMCCDELLSAIEKKDKKEILESLKAIILSVGK